MPVRRAELWRSPIADSPPGAGQLWPSEAPSIHARAAIMIDARSGLTLFQKYADSHIQVASTQKLLTALIILRRGNLDGRLFVAAPDTFVEPTKLGLRPGQSYTRRTLLSAMMVKSENDAAAALARDHSGSVVGFRRDHEQRGLGSRRSQLPLCQSSWAASVPIFDCSRHGAHRLSEHIGSPSCVGS